MVAWQNGDAPALHAGNGGSIPSATTNLMQKPKLPRRPIPPPQRPFDVKKGKPHRKRKHKGREE